jgi:hypothetical protein
MPRAANSGGGGFPDDDAHLDLKPLLRLCAWGGGACTAVAIVVMAAQSDIGGRRAEQAVASLSGTPTNQMAQTASADLLARADAERESRRLGDAIRILAGDRDRLAGRLALLERNIEDLTGSVARVAAHPHPPAEPAKPVEAPPAASPPQTMPAQAAAPSANGTRHPIPPEIVAAPVPPPVPPVPQSPAVPPAKTDNAAVPAPGAITPLWRENAELPAISPKEPRDAREAQDLDAVPLPRPGPVAMLQSYAGVGTGAGAGTGAGIGTSPAASTGAKNTPAAAPNQAAPRLDYAIDLGAAINLAGLRALWERVRIRQPASLEGLHPLVSVRDGAKAGSIELRLVAGPLADTTAVARVCAALISVGIACQPAVFDGQRLPSADVARPRPAPPPAPAHAAPRPPV